MTVKRPSRHRPLSVPPPPRADSSTSKSIGQPAAVVTKPVHREDGFAPRRDDGARKPARANATEKIGERPALPPKLRVVITGYGDFMGAYNEAEGRPNPSGVMARKLAEMGIDNAEVSYRQLEVTTDAVDAFMREMEANPPDVIISMGVAPKAQVEARPENWLAANEDGHGELMQARTIDPSRPAHERIASDLPISVIEEALAKARENGLQGATIGTPYNPAEKDTYAPDDSAYLCNYLNYHLAEAFGANDQVTAGFVHVTGETQPQEMRAVAQAVVNRQLERLQQGAPQS